MITAAPTLARQLADALEAATIPYAIGGALALGVWGFPRATNDVDLNVFIAADQLSDVLAVFSDAGCEVDSQSATARACERGDFQMTKQGIRIDVFVPSIPLYESTQRRIRRARLEGRPAWFLSAEDLATFKFLFFRTKDILDVERLVAFGGADFDLDYVRHWLVACVGEDDERVERWDRLVTEAGMVGNT